jgi:hypothetical protein
MNQGPSLEVETTRANVLVEIQKDRANRAGWGVRLQSNCFYVTRRAHIPTSMVDLDHLMVETKTGTCLSTCCKL